MSLKSMTGFANCSDALEDFSWRWEIRSVNGRGLDMRFRLNRRDGLEPLLREKIASKVKRGSLQVSLTIERDISQTQIDIDEEVLNRAIEAAKQLTETEIVSPPTADGLLALPGVMNEKRLELSEEETDAQQAALLNSFDMLLDGLNDMRAQEGGQIKRMLNDQIVEVKRLVGEARANPCRTADAIAERLSQQVGLLVANSDLSEERLYAEAALIAVKSDVQEELDRIDAHADSFKDILQKDEPVGRKLEFLTQELAREANTLCSKANDPSLTQTGLTLKTVIDQLREQSLNLE